MKIVLLVENFFFRMTSTIPMFPASQCVVFFSAIYALFLLRCGSILSNTLEAFRELQIKASWYLLWYFRFVCEYVLCFIYSVLYCVNFVICHPSIEGHYVLSTSSCTANPWYLAHSLRRKTDPGYPKFDAVLDVDIFVVFNWVGLSC